MNSHQSEKLPHAHLIHWIFPNFAHKLPVVIREIVCVLTSTMLLLALPAIVILFYLAGSEANMSASQIAQQILYFCLFIFGLAICFRIWTWGLVRFSSPYDWLISPIPIAVYFAVSTLSYIRWVTSKHIMELASAGANVMLIGPQFTTINTILGIVIGGFIVIPFFYSLRLSRAKKAGQQDSLSAAKIE